MKHHWPLVSVITPSFNSVRYIEETIHSVHFQSYPYIEHIVVDGGSTDGTVDILRQYTHLCWISEPDEGQADALNKGFAMANGEIIGWLNADDTYEPGTIEKAIRHLLACPDADGVYGQLRIVDKNGDLIHVSGPVQYTYEDVLLSGAVVPQQSAFWRRYVTEQVRLKVNLHFALDWDFWLQALSAFNFVAVAGCVGNLRLVEGSKTSTRLAQFWPEELRVLEHALANYRAVPDTLAMEARRRLQYKLGLSYASIGQFDEASKLLKGALTGDAYPFGSLQAIAEYTVMRALKPIHRPLPEQEAEVLIARYSNLLAPIDRDLAAYVRMLWALRAYHQGRFDAARRFGIQALHQSLTTWRNRGLWSATLRSLLGSTSAKADSA